MSLIRVEFVDITNAHFLPTMELEDTQLPASFELHTVMHVGDLQFEVVSANPIDFRKTGSLRLEMRPISMVDPGTVRYSLPTLCDSIPVATESWRPGCLQLHEDDWRQIELVSEDRRAEAEPELAAVRLILRGSEGHSFPELHVRRRPAEPLNGAGVALSALSALLPAEHSFTGLSYQDSQACVEDGFGWRTPGGLLVYGQAPQGVVSVACLELSAPPDPRRAGEAMGLEKLARERQLVLVDWCAAALIAPSDFASYFQTRGGFSSVRRQAL